MVAILLNYLNKQIVQSNLENESYSKLLMSAQIHIYKRKASSRRYPYFQKIFA